MRLVLVPFKKELDCLVSVLNGAEKNEHGYFYKDLQFVVAGAGKSKFLDSTYKYYDLLKPESLLAVGTCGSLQKFKPLDLVVVKEVVDYDLESSKQEIFQNTGSGGIFLELPRVVCASGKGDITKSPDKKTVLDKTAADVVTWESTGFFSAAKSLNASFIEVRVVTDYADESTVADFKKNLSLGMQKIGMLFK